MDPFNNEEWQRHLLRIQALRCEDHKDIFYLGPDKWKAYRRDAEREQEKRAQERQLGIFPQLGYGKCNQDMAGQLASAATRAPLQRSSNGNAIGAIAGWAIGLGIAFGLLCVIGPGLLTGLGIGLLICFVYPILPLILVIVLLLSLICSASEACDRANIRRELERHEQRKNNGTF